MPEMVERALLIMDAILRSMSANKWKVKTPAEKDRTKNSVEIDGVTVLFTITEQRTQERIKSDDRWREWEYWYHSSGILRFQYGAGSYVQEIKDNKKLKLEQRIGDIVQALRDEVKRTQDAEIKKRERERLHRLWETLSLMVQKALKYNAQCENRLDEYLAQHEQAIKIRSFVDGIKQRTAADPFRPQQQRWVEWGQRRADEIDPVTNFEELDYAVSETVSSQVQSIIDAEPECYGELNELDLERSIGAKLGWIKKYPEYAFGR